MDSSKIKMQDKRSINLTCMIKVDAESDKKPRRFKFDTPRDRIDMGIYSIDNGILV